MWKTQTIIRQPSNVPYDQTDSSEAPTRSTEGTHVTDDVERPNVLVVLTDQQRWDTVGAYGSPLEITPNLDRMAESGTVLERSFTTQPVCGPSRACIQTGRHATEHGVWKNTARFEYDGPTLAETFSNAGYDTGYVGKWHLANTETDPVPPERRAGYDGYWRAADVLEFTSGPESGYVHNEDSERIEFEDYRVDAMTDFAVDFLHRDRDDPFFLFLSYLEPHHQNDMNAYVAPEGYAERHANPWVPPDLRDRPGDWYESLPDYYGICERIDESLGQLLEELKDTGVADETIVLFTSDHGCHFRTRNAEYKRSCHESSIRVPSVYCGPGFDDGGRVDELTTLLDVPPTLIDAAGLEVPDEMKGQSVRPLVDDPLPEWRDDIFVQISESAVERAIRTDQWKYAVYAPEKDGFKDSTSDEYVERYLYDLRADPHEEVNLVGRPDHREIADILRERLLERIKAVEGGPVEIRRADHHA